MGRFFRTIRGFFGRLLTGVEQRNPEILLENAVQDELDNLKRLQVAAARTMAYEKMLANDAASKQKTVTVKERQSRELAARGQREAAIEVVQQKQEAQTQLAEIESRLGEARKNSEEMEQAFRDQERRYNDIVEGPGEGLAGDPAGLLRGPGDRRARRERDRAPDSGSRGGHKAPRRRARAGDDRAPDGPPGASGGRTVGRGAIRGSRRRATDHRGAARATIRGGAPWLAGDGARGRRVT